MVRTFLDSQGLPFVRVEVIAHSKLVRGQQHAEWNGQAGALAEVEMTAEELRLMSQMNVEERQAFWTKKKKVERYKELVERTIAETMQVETFQNIVDAEVEERFVDLFRSAGLWNNEPELNKALELLSNEVKHPCDKEGTFKKNPVVATDRITLYLKEQKHIMKVVGDIEAFTPPDEERQLQEEALEQVAASGNGIWVPRLTREGAYTAGTTRLSELEPAEDDAMYDIRNLVIATNEESKDFVIQALHNLISKKKIGVIVVGDSLLYLSSDMVAGGSLIDSGEDWLDEVIVGQSVSKQLKAAWYESHWEKHLQGRLAGGVWASGMHFEVVTINGTAEGDEKEATEEPEAIDQIWNNPHPLSNKNRVSWRSGYLAYLAEKSIVDIYKKQGQILVIEHESPWKLAIITTALKVGENANMAKLEIPEKEAENFENKLREALQKNELNFGALRVMKNDGETLELCEVEWTKKKVPWMKKVLEDCEHGFASGGTTFGRIMKMRVQNGDILCFEEDDMFTLMIPRHNEEIVPPSQIYDREVLKGVFDVWEKEDAPERTMFNAAIMAGAVQAAKEVLKRSPVIIVGATMVGQKMETTKDERSFNSLPTADYRKQIQHPIFSTANAKKAILIALKNLWSDVFIRNVGQLSEAPSILTIPADFGSVVKEWEPDDERLRKWNPIISTFEQLEAEQEEKNKMEVTVATIATMEARDRERPGREGRETGRSNDGWSKGRDTSRTNDESSPPPEEQGGRHRSRSNDREQKGTQK